MSPIKTWYLIYNKKNNYMYIRIKSCHKNNDSDPLNILSTLNMVISSLEIVLFILCEKAVKHNIKFVIVFLYI